MAGARSRAREAEQEHARARDVGHISRPSKDSSTHLGVAAGRSEEEEDTGKLVHLGSTGKLQSATQPKAASAPIESTVERTTRAKIVERTSLPRGLPNEGLTCALNTLMQCLAACPPVVAALNASTSKGPIAALRSLINAILDYREAVIMMELPRRNATSLTGSRLAPITIIISRG